jgi:cell division protein FtsB
LNVSELTARALPIVILGLAAIAVPVLVLEPAGFPRLRSLKSELAAVAKENAALRKEISELRVEVKELRENPAAVERIARDQLGLVRKSEVVFQFTSRPK